MRSNPSKVSRRPSMDIANDFIEMDFKAVMDADRMATMSKRERRKFERKQRKACKPRHSFVKIVASLMTLIVILGGCGCLWWSTSTNPVDAKDTNTRQFEAQWLYSQYASFETVYAATWWCYPSWDAYAESEL